MEQRTLPNLFETSVKKYASNTLMWEKTGEVYESHTYAEMKALVYKFGAGLLKLGLGKGERAALISEGSNDWVMSELGILYCGAINVPVSVKINEPNDLKFRLSHSECKFIIVSKNQLPKVRRIKNDLPELEKVIVLDNVESLESDEMTKDEVFKLGVEYLEDNKDYFDERWQSISEDDTANICYTSGTTADPKGIMLTHRNYTSNVDQSTGLLPIPEYYVSLLILPLDHSFAHTVGIYTLMKNGAAMAAVQVGATGIETLKNIPVNIKEVRPTFLLSVPSLAKNFRKNIEANIRSKGEKIEKLFNKALETAYGYNGRGCDKGRGMKKLKKPLLMLYDKILFSKIREAFGGRLEFFIGGGALLDIELQKFFYAIGIPMYQGYGLSEAAPVISSNVPVAHKMGSSGKIVNDLLVKICDDDGIELPAGEKGEIVCKGENVMKGYWKNDKATAEVIKDGWLYTGDMGYIDEDGYLYVLGRFKSLLIGGDGEKYSPEGIEEAVVEKSPLIDQVMLHNNQDPYTVGLIVPNKEKLKSILHKEGLELNKSDGQKRAIELLQNEITKFKPGGEFEGQFPERWLPSTFAVLGEGFTEENTFMNSTLKIVRGKITEFYRNRIDYMYTPEGSDVFNRQNMRIIERL